MWLRTYKFLFWTQASTGRFPSSTIPMPPHNDTSFIVGKYVESLGYIWKGVTYIIVTAHDGIVYKRLAEKKKTLITVFPRTTLNISPMIFELREFACSLNTEEATISNSKPETLEELVKEMHRDIQELKQRK